MMGHLNSFPASGGGNLNKNFPKIKMPGGGGGGGCLSFDLTGTLFKDGIYSRAAYNRVYTVVKSYNCFTL